MYALLLRPVKNQIVHILQNPMGGRLTAAAVGPEGLELAEGAGIPMVQGGVGVEHATAGNAKTVTTLKKQLATKVKEDPDAASRLIQNWLKEGEARK